MQKHDFGLTYFASLPLLISLDLLPSRPPPPSTTKMSRLCTLSITDTRLLSVARGSSSKTSQATLAALQSKFDVSQQNMFCINLRRKRMEERMAEVEEEIERLKVACEESTSLPRHRAAVQITTLRDEYIDRKQMLETQRDEAQERAVLLQSELLQMLAPYIEACLEVYGVKRDEARGTTSTFYDGKSALSKKAAKVSAVYGKIGMTCLVRKEGSDENIHHWQEPMYLFKDCPMWMKRAYPRRLENGFAGRLAAYGGPQWWVWGVGGGGGGGGGGWGGQRGVQRHAGNPYRKLTLAPSILTPIGDSLLRRLTTTRSFPM